MKVFLSSTYVDLIEHRKAAHDENHPRMNPRMREWRVFYSFTLAPDASAGVRELFADGSYRPNRISP